MISADAINGLILAGGRSSRMGSDKSQLEYNAMPQCDFLANTLTPFCNQVFFSCRKYPGNTAVPVLIDQFGFEGPLNGILTAFRQNPAVGWLTVPVDMPHINTDVIQRLIAGRNPQKIATCFYDSTGKQPEPLLAIYEPAASAKMLAYYNCGGRSPREFLLQNDTWLLTPADSAWLFNVNTPEDLAEFRKTLQIRQKR